MFRQYILTIIREKNTGTEGKVPAEDGFLLQSNDCRVKIKDGRIDI